MVSFLYQHEWLLFFISESLTWISLLLFLLIRYKYNLIRLSQTFLLIVIFCTLFQGILVGVDFYHTGQISLFQIVIILLILYGSTLGSNDFQRLDSYIQQKLIKKRSSGHNGDFLPYIKYRSRLFIIHTIAFISINFYWLIIDTNLPVESHGIHLIVFNETFKYILPNIFNTLFINMISFLWIIIYFFDFCVYLFYRIWLFRNNKQR